MATTITATRQVVEDYQRLFVNRRAYIGCRLLSTSASGEALVQRNEFFGLRPELILHPAFFDFAVDSRAQDLALRHTFFWFWLSTSSVWRTIGAENRHSCPIYACSDMKCARVAPFGEWRRDVLFGWTALNDNVPLSQLIQRRTSCPRRAFGDVSISLRRRCLRGTQELTHLWERHAAIHRRYTLISF